jgi:hypothetical protein
MSVLVLASWAFKSLVSYDAKAMNFTNTFIALMMEAARTSEMLVNFYQTTQR